MGEQQQPEGNLDHSEIAAPQAPKGNSPPVLNYSSGPYPPRNRRDSSNFRIGEFLLGFCFWVVSVISSYGVLGMLGALAHADRAYVFVTVEIITVIAASAWIQHKMEWRSFLPGVFAGVGLTCLVPIGMVAVMCTNFKI